MNDPPHARISLLVSPTSRRGFTERDGIRAARYLRVLGSDVVGLTARSVERATRMSSATAISERLDALFVVGGDGTVGIVADALTDSKIPPRVLAVGTDNDAAWHFGLPRRDVDAALTFALDVLESKRTFAANVLKVALEAGSKRVVSVVSAGLDADVSRRANSFSLPCGGTCCARRIVSAVANFAPYGFRSEIDGRACSAPAILVSVANTRFFGTDLPIAPSTMVTGRLTDVVFATSLGRLQIIDPLHRLALECHPNRPPVHSVRACRIHIACKPRAGTRSSDPMADGDRPGTLPIDAAYLSGTVEVLI